MIGLEDGLLPREPDRPRVELGQTVMTIGVSEGIAKNEVFRALQRHESGDWGEVCPEDRETNEEALKSGDRLLSIYKDSKGTKFYVITEADRSVTTVLLTSEY
jgi:hypothetical protein